MASPKVARSAAVEVAALLDSPEISALVAELDELRWTGRKGYGARTLVGACLTKALYAIPTWTRTARLIAEHRTLAEAIGGIPSEWACYRFTVKLRRHSDKLAACLDRVTASLSVSLPEIGRDVAIDASDLPAYGNGMRLMSKNGPERERFSDPDAAWGHRSAVSTRKGGGFFGFRLHAAVCSRTGLPLAWRVTSANVHESKQAIALIDVARLRGFAVASASMDKGYDNRAIYDECNARGIAPIVPLRATLGVREGRDEPPSCEHGRWTFAGADFKRKAAKWRCPAGECQPKSVWVKADRLHPLIPRESERYKTLRCGRAAVEREFGRLKHQYGLAPLRVRGLQRVQLHADLVMLARLSQALSRARAVTLAA